MDYQDQHGRTLAEGDSVTLVDIDPDWFAHCPKLAQQQLLSACQGELKIAYFDDDYHQACIDLPATRDHDGELISNSLHLTCDQLCRKD
ncbi:hypothetical protein [Thaumasiovibrio subtropicus]|uniref:hypothetical protein n=1 Tax=Thaumasiovibrio subtropicus TaxID=1891207 RepID=UPI000B3577B1|nr:hypothetical protein [Thaumasiovibrio subtropicus]